MPKKKQQSGGDIPEWVVTYGDLMSLLLCFFILLAAFSEMKQPREFQKVLDHIKEALGASGGMGIAELLDDAPNSSYMNNKNARAAQRESGKSPRDNIEQNVTGKRDQVSIIHEGQRFAIGGSVPFNVADYELSRVAEDMLRNEIAPRIRDQNFIVVIAGHAWGEQEKASGLMLDKLAFERAYAVKDFLVRECEVSELILRIESAGASEPQSLDADSLEDGVVNRRVQVYQTGRTIDQMHPDPSFAGTP